MPAEAADAERVLLFSTGNVFYLNDTKGRSNQLRLLLFVGNLKPESR